MSPRNEEMNAMIKDERREQILHAALMVFATKGFAACKISDIVAKGGMSHGLVYHYFKSKEEIFYELLKRAMWVSTQSLMMVEGMPLSPIEKVRQTAKYILGAIADFEDTAYYFLIVTHASIMEGPDVEREKYIHDSNIAIQAFVRFLQAGQEAGEVREGDPLEMSIVFFSAIQGLAMYKLSMQDFKMPDPEILVNMVKKQ
jgi:AcrR family transcriptional regulator